MMSSLRVSEPRRCLEVCRVLTGFQWSTRRGVSRGECQCGDRRLCLLTHPILYDTCPPLTRLVLTVTLLFANKLSVMSHVSDEYSVKVTTGVLVTW
jgi:hypothetical protein